MPVVHTPRKPKLDVRVLLFPVVIFALLLVLLIRLWYIQVVRGPELRERADLYGSSRSSILAPRGLIDDRNGTLIAGIQSELVLTAKPAVVSQEPGLVDRVAQMLNRGGVKGIDAERLKRKLDDVAFRRYLPTPIFPGIPLEIAGSILEDEQRLNGIGVETQPTRFYPDSKSFSHLLGYVWVPSPEDIQRAQAEGREAADYVGKGGLEWMYEKDLMGADGYESMLLDSKKRPVRVAERENPTPGAHLTLTLDAEAQRAAVKAMGSHRGAVVAIEPQSGEVLCMASTPTFDLSLFRNGISRQDFDALNNSPEHPFLNRALSSAFAPGSTFKIVTTVAAMRAGVFDPNRTVFCGGGYRLGKQYFKCLGHHGNISFETALEKSCNTYFADLAMRVGKDALRQTALDMGFFAKTGIDLPYERTGLIPTDDWLDRVHRPWVPGYTVLTGIGQGDVLATPLQMAELASMVANGGVTYKTHLVREIRSQSEDRKIEPEVLRSVALPPDQWRLIQQAMIGVVDHGTAAGSRIPGVTWAGKTGSAEVAGQARTNSWFIGYAPADHPRIAICVVVEGVGHGSDFAAPVARQVVERYLRYYSALR